MGRADKRRSSYLRIGEVIERTKSLPLAKPSKKHSYIREAVTHTILSGGVESLQAPPLLRLVPAFLEAVPKPWEGERFETDRDEAERVTILLALLFTRAAEAEPISQATRDALGITDTDIKAIADKIGKARAAEIMGLKWDAAGDLVPDPGAEHAITATTEKQVNELIDGFPATWAPGQGPNDTQEPVDTTEEDLALAILALFAFSDVRPDVVADMETGMLQNELALEAYEAGGVAEVLVHDGEEWDEECAAVDGMVWPISRARANLKQHPWCVRWFEPVL